VREKSSSSWICTQSRVPGGAQQGRELAGLPAEHADNGCEFFGEQEEPAIGDGLLIAQGVEDAVWGGSGLFVAGIVTIQIS
jgi:hypothetical protein